MPDEFERTDEFYSFKNIDPSIHAGKDRREIYQGGKNGDNHPMSWYHDFDGGRSFILIWVIRMKHLQSRFSWIIYGLVCSM